MMHILMLSDVYFPRINGVSTSIQTFATAFMDLGHSVTLIAPEYPATFDAEFEVIRVRSRRLPLDPEDRLMSLTAAKQLAPLLRSRQIDIVHIQTPFVAHYAGLHLGRALGTRVVVSYHTFFEAYFEKYLPHVPAPLLRWIARRFSRTQCNQVDAVISPSRPMGEKLLEYGVRRPAAVIPTGLPAENFRVIAHNDFRRRYGLREDAFVLLFVGRVAFEKNIEFLFEMFGLVWPIVANAVLLVAGEGPALSKLRALTARLGATQQIRFVGYLHRATELLACYQSSDVFVFASQTETQGLVLLEAMASGLPVVSTASMGCGDVLVDGEGCLVSPPEPQAFAERVISLHRDGRRRAELSRRAVTYARRWSGRVKARDMLAFYEQTLQSRASGGTETAPPADATSLWKPEGRPDDGLRTNVNKQADAVKRGVDETVAGD